MTDSEKMRKAQQLVCNDQYQNMRDDVNEKITESMDSLIALTRSRQNGAETVFTGVYRKIELCAGAVGTAHAGNLHDNALFCGKTADGLRSEHPARGDLPGGGRGRIAGPGTDLQRSLPRKPGDAEDHPPRAEHDALTGALNRGSFEKILNIYKNGEKPFAMIICDVDIFKHVNDTYGHAVGDEILKKVANLLKTTFRSIDYVCRIGR